MTVDTLFRARRAIVDGAEVSATIGVENGTIVSIEPYESPLPSGVQVIDLADDEVLIPGLVDTHVHVNEPGRTEWEGFASATRAAVAGGVTTIIDMPLNSIPPTTTVEALKVKQDVARDQVFVDVGFWGGAVPENFDDLEPLHQAGVFGFKCFTLPSGVDEFAHLNPELLHRAMTETGRLGAQLIVHAEDEHSVDVGTRHQPESSDYTSFLRSRPRGAENLAIAQLIELTREIGAPTHLLHLSSSDALAMIRSARAEGVPLTVETCPHYLTFAAETISAGATEFKCCPPIREQGNQDDLWAGLAEGLIDFVVTDHSPSTVELKAKDVGNFKTAWGGIAGLQVGLPAVWSGARSRGHSLTDVVRWMSTGPADFVGLSAKGRIAIGAQADFAVFAPDEEFVVDVAKLHHKNPLSAYAGSRLTGVVRQTWLRGDAIEIQEAPQGRLLSRGEA